MAKVLITIDLDQEYVGEIAKKGHNIINKKVDENELKELIQTVDCIVVGQNTCITKEIIDIAVEGGKLELIVRAGETLDNIDVKYAKKRGIRVFNAPGTATNAVAELVIGQMLTLARSSHIADMDIRNGIWDPDIYHGTEVSRKTLGLIGFGRVARAVAEKAKPLSLNVIYYDKNNVTELYGYKPVTMDKLLTQSDYISVHIPGDEENENVIDKDTFALMKDGVIFLNYSSGKVVDEEALLDAIDSGKVRAAGLGVFKEQVVTNERMLKNRHLSLTPHIGSKTVEARLRISKMVVKLVTENL